MKKGCLVKGLVLSTILFAGLFYLITNESEDLIVKPVKEFFIKNSLGNINSKIKQVKSSKEKDSLISVFNSYINSIKEYETIHINDIDQAIHQIDLITKDKKVDSAELKKFISLIQEYPKNERSKKN
jgi:hypothetical protein